MAEKNFGANLFFHDEEQKLRLVFPEVLKKFTSVGFMDKIPNLYMETEYFDIGAYFNLFKEEFFKAIKSKQVKTSSSMMELKTDFHKCEICKVTINMKDQYVRCRHTIDCEVKTMIKFSL